MFQKVISKKPSEFTGTLSISTKCVMLFTQSKERLASIPFAAHIKELYWSGLTLPALLQDGSKRTLYVPGVTSKKRKIDFRPVLALALDKFLNVLCRIYARIIYFRSTNTDIYIRIIRSYYTRIITLLFHILTYIISTCIFQDFRTVRSADNGR